MVVRGHVKCGEERQADDVGDGADQLGPAGAAGPAAAAVGVAGAGGHAAAAPDAVDAVAKPHPNCRLLTRYAM